MSFNSRIHELGVACPDCGCVVFRKSDGACVDCIDVILAEGAVAKVDENIRPPRASGKEGTIPPRTPGKQYKV